MTDLRFQPSAIEHWPIERLVPYAANARTHSAEQVVQLAASLARFGWTVPVMVDEKGVLIAGHGRLLAARHLGLKEVPVIRLHHLGEADARAYRLADNRLGELSTWDDELLAAELSWLQEEGLDLDVIGFSDEDLERLLAGDVGDGPMDGDEDAVPEPPADPVTKPGDLWLLGSHRLLCGDATVLADVEKVLGGNSADMCFTDSPYNINYHAPRNGAKDRRILNDALGEGFAAFLYDACINILAVTKGAVYMCMSSSELHTLQKAFVAAGGHWSTFVIWAKNTFTLGRSDYQRQYEPILYGWKEGGAHHWCGARDQGDVWFVDKPARNDLHPTMKPVDLVERALRNSSKSRDIVLDPFCGSGTTLIAAETTSRVCLGIEIDPRYCDVIVNRWQNLTGGTATLEGDGRTFNEIAALKPAA
jgi:DNA modification methylase